MIPMVYIAGPISSNPMHGTNAAVHLASRMLDDGIALPFIPHLTVLWDMIAPRHYEDWMNFDLAVIENKCDAVYRLPGESPGADRETAHARLKGIPVFNDYHDFDAWCRT